MTFLLKGPLRLLVVFIVGLVFFLHHVSFSHAERYRVSVFEFTPHSPLQGANLSRTQALIIMKTNVEIYEKQARIAGQNRNDMIVFPEYGLFGIFGYDKYARRSDIYPFLETIPDPRKVSWNPCQERISQYPSTEIQKALSCMAKNYDMYLVANVGEKVPCKQKYDHNCPSDGRYQFNTNVVYSSNGTLVAKYRKKHLFKENYYDSPSKTEIVKFKTHFGDFGLITSHDSLFKSPLLDLVERLKVRDIVMPNAWKTSRPLFRSIQWHSSLAQGLQINLLVATVHDGHCESYGSGLYGRDGAKTYVSDKDRYEGKLISDLVRYLPYSEPRERRPVIPKRQISQVKTYNDSMAFLDRNISFKFLKLTKSIADVNVCYGRFCCQLEYTVHGRIEEYALAIYKGPVRTLGYSLEVEVCAVVRCYPKCGKPIQRANTYFDKFHLVGINFSTPYIYPQVLTLNGRVPELPTHQWDYKHGEIMFSRAPDNPLHSASLIGRVYDKDAKDHRSAYSADVRGGYPFSNGAPSQKAFSLILVVALIVSLTISS